MDFSLNEEQRAWQLKAQNFANTEISPISLERDQIIDPAATFDWEIIKKGSRLGFRTAVVPQKYGGHEIDFVTQTLVMIELSRGDCAIAKTFSQCWKWSHLLANICTDEQKERFLIVPTLHQGLQSFRSMRRTEANFKKAMAVRLRFSQSLASRRQRLSHAIVRSTIQRLGNCTNPFA